MLPASFCEARSFDSNLRVPLRSAVLLRHVWTSTQLWAPFVQVYVPSRSLRALLFAQRKSLLLRRDEG